MTPFLSLRLWLRRSPSGERAVVAVVGTVLVDRFLKLRAQALVALVADHDLADKAP